MSDQTLPKSSTLMAKAWDEPAPADVQPAINSPRRFGRLENLSVPDTFNDALSDAEIAAWEGNSPSQAPGCPSSPAVGITSL
jgi:hypothetical protein